MRLRKACNRILGFTVHELDGDAGESLFKGGQKPDSTLSSVRRDVSRNSENSSGDMRDLRRLAPYGVYAWSTVSCASVCDFNNRAQSKM